MLLFLETLAKSTPNAFTSILFSSVSVFFCLSTFLSAFKGTGCINLVIKLSNET